MSTKDLGSLKVLVVDDMAITRKVVRKFICNYGILTENIQEATNGIHALEIIDKNPINLILSDWHMPEMTGIELLEKVRANTDKSEIKFIMITSEIDDDHVQKAKSLGLNKFIAKPFNQQDLFNVLDDIIKN